MIAPTLIRKRTRRGGIAVLVVISLPVLLIIVSFAVQLTYLDLARVELRTATDAAAEAGARTLSRTGNTAMAIAAAKAAAARNTVCGQPCVLEDDDVAFGLIARVSANGRFLFSQGGPNPNAVRIDGSAERDAISHVLGGTINVRLSAVAGQIDRDIALVLDRSGSMAESRDDGTTTDWVVGERAPIDSRWDSVADASMAFLLTLQNETPMVEYVSLVTYNESGDIDSELTADYSQHIDRINEHTSAYNGGSTNIADGIEVGRQTLRDNGNDRSWAAKTIVVMTDGNHNTGVDPLDAATFAADEGVTIHTITYGADADQDLMSQIAMIGGGNHWHAPDGSSLALVFQEIAANLPTMLVE